jgi:hypothetical protein
MALVTSRQRKKIEKIIRDHHLAFAAEVLGEDAIDADDYARLSKEGKIKKPMKVNAAEAAHILGVLAGEGEPEAVARMTPASFWALASGSPPTLSLAEKEAVTYAKSKIGEYIKGLGNKIESKTGQLIVEADNKLRKKVIAVVREEVARGIAEKKSISEIAGALAKATKDTHRNWLQIAATEVHNAMEEGKASALMNGLPKNSDPLVYKRPRPDACPFCKMLYMNGKVPRIFHLSELVANGTNVDRRAKRATMKGPSATEWKAVLGSMHPWCQCQLHHLPAGMGFDTSGNLIYIGVKKSMITIESLNKELLNHECVNGD